MTSDAMHPPVARVPDAAATNGTGWLARLTDAICGLAAAGTVLVVLAQVASRLLGFASRLAP